MQTAWMAIATGCAIGGAVLDLRRRRIPNWLSYGGLATALTARLLWSGWRGMVDGLLGMLICAGLLLLFFLRGGMGGGDVKLMAAVGAWAGARGGLLVLQATALAGLLLALGLIWLRARTVETLRNALRLARFHFTTRLRPHPEWNLESPAALRLPYALAIALGAAYAWLAGPLGR